MGIGLASEAIHHHRNKSATALAKPSEQVGESSRAGAQNNYDEPPPEYVEVSTEDASRLIAQGQAIPADTKEKHDFQTEEHDEEDSDSDTDSEQGDEEQWALDEAAERSGPSTPSGEPTQDAGKLIDAFIRNHPRPASSGPQPKLPCPVILPQRRPKDKKRGFIRAYAPLLQDCGIDQATFLEFLETFYQSSKSSPWLNVINAAAGIVGFVPGPITMGVSIATQFAVGVAMELQSRSRSNTFLDKINNEFFVPRGLYCLVLTYKPESSATHASVDINKAIYSSMDESTTGFKKTMRNIRLSSGTTYGELQMPESAPLIFPALEQKIAMEGDENVKKENAMKRTGNFINDYMDRRAQAAYAMQNPNSSLTTPRPEFMSRYSDPNHPASSGSLISLITGGHVTKGTRSEKMARREARRGEKRLRKARRRGEVITPETATTRRRTGLVRRILQKNVLYLMIVSFDRESPEFQAGMTSVTEEPRQ
ncbi:FAD binding domain protein [Rutstroemia sp. NJR-2017a BVV2]|nr:FAD binding domain protein [Rutstroemia sp. NJR-2017a BVV2]